jgi:hypothetical protein
MPEISVFSTQDESQKKKKKRRHHRRSSSSSSNNSDDSISSYSSITSRRHRRRHRRRTQENSHYNGLAPDQLAAILAILDKRAPAQPAPEAPPVGEPELQAKPMEPAVDGNTK